MEWWAILLIAALVIQFSFIGWVVWQERDAYNGREDTIRHDPSRASWTSSAMQDEMGGGE